MSRTPGGDGTNAVHGGTPVPEPVHSLVTPVYRTSTFRFATTDDLLAAARGERPGFYTRYGHPNFDVVEEKFARLHGAEGALCFASGMAALAAAFGFFLRPREPVVAFRDLYGGTRALLSWLVERDGIELRWVDVGDLDALEAALPGARLLVGESPTNPLLRILDLPAVSERARGARVPFLLDNTFAGPLGQRPLEHGVDLVMESATKFLGGHSDLIAGMLAGARESMARLDRHRRLTGGVLDPETAWLLERGMRTLAVRYERQARTAATLAERLAQDPRVTAVLHPGLPAHPDHDTARRLHARAGGMLTIRCAAGEAAARAVADRVRLVANAPSLGGVESVLSIPHLTSHAALTPEERARAGISNDLVRFSFGLEDVEDLWADLDHALG